MMLSVKAVLPLCKYVRTICTTGCIYFRWKYFGFQNLLTSTSGDLPTSRFLTNGTNWTPEAATFDHPSEVHWYKCVRDSAKVALSSNRYKIWIQETLKGNIYLNYCHNGKSWSMMRILVTAFLTYQKDVFCLLSRSSHTWRPHCCENCSGREMTAAPKGSGTSVCCSWNRDGIMASLGHPQLPPSDPTCISMLTAFFCPLLLSWALIEGS